MANTLNGKPWQVVLDPASSRINRSVFSLDLEPELDNVQAEEGKAFLQVSLKAYEQAQAIVPTYRTFPGQLLRYKNFNGLQIPVMYYHPAERQQAVLLVISLHGGPTSQVTSLFKPYDIYMLPSLLGRHILL